MKQNKYTPENKKASHLTSSLKKFRIICTPTFLSEAKKLLSKYPNIKQDFFRVRDILKNDPITGNDFMGNDIYKVRMLITDKNTGESGGARIIVQVKISDGIVYVVSVYDKSRLGNILDRILLDKLRKNNLICL